MPAKRFSELLVAAPDVLADTASLGRLLTSFCTENLLEGYLVDEGCASADQLHVVSRDHQLVLD